ncbi:MAG TPA: hypothetical protein VEC93_15110, partial [Anaerolineae bacterium]|nr:hypothetical protein [Anaerolineae bacterium]
SRQKANAAGVTIGITTTRERSKTMASSSVKMARCVNCNEIKAIKRRGMCHNCATYFYRHGKMRQVRPGERGCNSDCVKWQYCQQQQAERYTGPLPCEEVWPDDDPDLYDESPGLNMQRPISVEIELKVAM